MIFWLLIALLVFIVSIYFAVRSMRSIAKDEAELFASQLPPQPPMKGDKTITDEKPSADQSAHAILLQKNAKVVGHEAADTQDANASVAEDTVANDVQQSYAAPKSVAEARFRLQEEISKATFGQEKAQDPDDTGSTQSQSAKVVNVGEKKYLGEYKGTVVLQNK